MPTKTLSSINVFVFNCAYVLHEFHDVTRVARDRISQHVHDSLYSGLLRASSLFRALAGLG